jgi:hypothetical protein
MKNFIKRIKEKIDAILKRMAENNRKEFGSKRMNCCDLKDHHINESH